MMSHSSTLSSAKTVQFRAPAASDGLAVHQLIDSCKPLDTNSLYCNLLQCSHFAETCLLAEQEGQVVAFVSGYCLPERPDTLFIWQVAVSSAARGQGLGKRLLQQILLRPACRDVRYLHTTITEDNQASWALFSALAESLSASRRSSVMFDRQQHFGDAHDSELLVEIGPFNTAILENQ